MSIKQHLNEKVLILDGAMGTMIQQYPQYKGYKNCDQLNLSHPEIVEEIHRKYLSAGADIIQTNTFNSSNDRELNLRAVDIAKKSALQYSTAEKPRFVAGTIGPQIKDSYSEQAKHLIEGGVDLLLIETILDLNSCQSVLESLKSFNSAPPIMLSVTVQKNSPLLLSGETIKDFINLASQHDILSLGINCSYGPRQVTEAVTELALHSNLYISLHTNAGLPNHEGQYDVDANEMSEIVDGFLSRKLINIVGGCCGTTDEHIREIARVASRHSPRKISP